MAGGATIAQVPSGMHAQPMAGAMGAMELQTCWYDEHGNLTGATPATAGTKPGNKVRGDAHGNHAWGYTVEGHDASVCPSRLPVSTIN